MTARCLLTSLAVLALLVLPISAYADDSGPVRAQERALSDLDPGLQTVLVTAASGAEIRFSLPPHIETHRIALRLAARPFERPVGEILISLNGGAPVRLDAVAQSIETRFDLPVDFARPGENLIAIRYAPGLEAEDAAWIIDGRRSRLRVEAGLARPLAGLGEFETALAADFAAPRRIAISAAGLDDRVALEALVAQGLALRAGHVPMIAGPNDRAELAIVFAVGEAPGLTGPRLTFRPGPVPTVLVAGRDAVETMAAARLFAARSLAGHGVEFTAANAVRAPRLRRAPAWAAMSARPDLTSFAATAAPFGQHGGARTAVIISAVNDNDRAAALSLLARASLVTGEAWLYAWYGDDASSAPGDHHWLALGPGVAHDRAIMTHAPSEMRSALRAADRPSPRRSLLRMGAAAYADDVSNETEALPATGVAAVFADTSAPERWIVAFTAPDGAAFAPAARTLARSDLWGLLEGRAALWTAAGVTPYDFTLPPPAEGRSIFGVAIEMRTIAALLFSIAFLFLFTGMLRHRKRVNALSSRFG